MPKPVYSRRYPKEGEELGGKWVEMERGATDEWRLDALKGPDKRDWIFGKAVEVTHLNRYDVDIFEGAGTLMVKIFLNFPSDITEIGSILDMADMVSICDPKDGHNAAVSIFYDLDVI